MIDALKLSIEHPDSASDGRKPLPKIVRYGLAAVAVVAVLLCVLAYRSIIDTATTPYCAANLKNIGIACMVYAERHNGNFPDTLEEMLRTTDLSVACLVCPASHDVAAPGNSAAEEISHLHDGNHLSYVYAGKGLTTSIPNPATVVVAYESSANNHRAGRNVLFADGHVACVPAKEAKELIASIPVTRPTTGP